MNLSLTVDVNEDGQITIRETPGGPVSTMTRAQSVWIAEKVYANQGRAVMGPRRTPKETDDASE